MPTKTEITALVKEYNSTRNERLKLTAEAAKLEQREKAILDSFTTAKIASGKYGPYEVEVKTKRVPRVTDWVGFHAYIRESGNFDMLHKRITESAIMARLDNGEFVPAVMTDDKTTYTFKLA